MTILEYYKNKQNDNNWVQEFQSTAQNRHGKIFNCLNVNFRSLKAYYTQLDAFKGKDGLKRSEWNDYQDNGQEKDKHRVQTLKNAGFVLFKNDRYYITDKGKTALKIDSNEGLTDKEKWILLYMLIIDYKFANRDIDIVRSVLDITTELEKFDINATKLIAILKESISLKDKNIFFTKDVFWLVTFYKDNEFVELYLKSSADEKKQLYDWVLLCSKNKKSADCIAHKFVSGGAYSGSMFNEDINIILCSLILITLQDKNYNNFINLIGRLYNIRTNKIKDIIEENKNIFDESYMNSIGKINKLLAVVD